MLNVEDLHVEERNQVSFVVACGVLCKKACEIAVIYICWNICVVISRVNTSSDVVAVGGGLDVEQNSGEALSVVMSGVCMSG